MSDLVLYHYPKCSTCRKARKWLDLHGVSYRLIDLVEAPPAKKIIAALHAASGLPVAKLFNTSGVSYRQGGFKDKLSGMTDAQAHAALAADGKLIKRPLLVGKGVALVGFREAAYEDALGAGSA